VYVRVQEREEERATTWEAHTQGESRKVEDHRRGRAGPLVGPHGRRDQNDTIATHEQHLHRSLSPLVNANDEQTRRRIRE
jgi:hypothetical protein